MRKTITIMLIITILFGSGLFGKKNRADEDHSYVEMDELLEIADDPAELAKVRQVAIIAYEYDEKTEKAVDAIKHCPNVNYIYICAEGIHLDKDFFNSISTSAYDLTLSLQWVSIDFEGVNNPKIKGMILSENVVEHYEEIVHLENLDMLMIDTVDGFCQADYSKLSHLDCLILTGQRIEDYQEFFQSVQHIPEIGLQYCNMQNSDARYLTEYMKELENLSLAGTYVDDISFLPELPKLRMIDLPLGVSDLSALYDMPDLECVSFEAYTELFVDKELTAFFDEHEIAYTDFDRDVRKKVDEIAASLDISDQDTDEEKIRKVTEFVLLNMRSESVDNSDFAGTTLDACLLKKGGLCHDYAMIEYTLLKYVGVDAYLIRGYATDWSGSAPGAHAWNEIRIGDSWYGLDPMWLDSDVEDPTTDKYKEEMWPYWYLQLTTTDDPEDYPRDGDFSDCVEKAFPVYHRTMNDPVYTLGKVENKEKSAQKDQDEEKAESSEVLETELETDPSEYPSEESMLCISVTPEVTPTPTPTPTAQSDGANAGTGGSHVWGIVVCVALSVTAAVAVLLAVVFRKK